MENKKRHALREKKLENKLNEMNDPFEKIIHYHNELDTDFLNLELKINNVAQRKIKLNEEEGLNIADEFSITLTCVKAIHKRLKKIIDYIEDSQSFKRDKELTEFFKKEDLKSGK